MIRDISLRTGKTKQDSSVLLAEYLYLKEKDLYMFADKNKKRNEYEIRF